MTTHPEVIKHSDVINQLVIDRVSMEELGRVEVLWMHPPIHRVLGFICKSGFLGSKKSAFKLTQLHALGTNGVLTHSTPDATDAERVRQLESLIQGEVWTDGGRRVGKIIDCLFHLRTGVITDYLLVCDRWAGIVGTIYRLPPSQIVSVGRRRALIADATVGSLAIYREGIGQRLSKTGSVLKEDYQQVTQELRSLAEQAQDGTQQAKRAFKSLADQAKERAQLLTEQVQHLREQVQDNVQAVAHQAQELTEVWLDDAKERVQDWRAEPDELNTLTVSAQEVQEETAVAEELDFVDWEDDSPDPVERPISSSFTHAAAQPEADADDEDWWDWEEPTEAAIPERQPPSEPIDSGTTASGFTAPEASGVTPEPPHSPANEDSAPNLPLNPPETVTSPTTDLDDVDDDDPWI